MFKNPHFTEEKVEDSDEKEQPEQFAINFNDEEVVENEEEEDWGEDDQFVI